MSDISIPGLSSRYNTNELVEGLVEAERIRLTRLQDQVTELETTRSTWREVNRQVGDLQRSAKSLYGFENPFSERTAVSSSERILTALASRITPIDDYEVTVRRIATSDRFLSPSLPRSFRVEAGTYTFNVGEESVSLRYRGGSLEDFARRLNEKGTGLVRASTVRDTTQTQVLLIESVLTGESNRLNFVDDAGALGLELGMLRPAQTESREAILDGLAAQEDSVGIAVVEGVVSVSPGASTEIPFEAPAILNENMVLEYDVRVVNIDEDSLVPPAPPGPLWPQGPDGSFEDVTVRGSGNDFPLPTQEPWTPPPRVDDPSVLTAQGSNRMALPDVDSSETYRTVRITAEDLPSVVNSLELVNRNTHRLIEIRDIRIYDPNRQGDLEPANPLSTASDALIEFRGIEARRPTNTIDDLIDGLTLNLHRASDEPVDLSVEPSVETAKEGLIRFVFNYNQLVTKILVLTNDDPTIIDELEYLDDDERERLEGMMGSMRSDLMLIQLKNRLQAIISSPYETREGSNLALLAQIGISTNASSGNLGGSLDFGKLRGYLEIDEEKLDAALAANIDAVRDLFGMDTTGDLVINSGVASAMDSFLVPYTQTGGFLTAKLTGIDSQIDSTNDDIRDYEVYLEDYEADLRRQYGNMEGMLNQLERSSQELDNFNRQSGGN